MNRPSIFRSVVAASFLLAPLVACEAEAPESASEDLTSSGKKLIGAYHFGSSNHKLVIDGLVLTAETVTKTKNRFFADVYTGKQCDNVSCDTVVRIEGSFKATKTTLTLTPDDEKWDDFFGKFKYDKSGESLTLNKEEVDGEEILLVEHVLEKKESYCGQLSAPEDCSEQSIVVPACLAVEFTCTVENTCHFMCKGNGGN